MTDPPLGIDRLPDQAAAQGPPGGPTMRRTLLGAHLPLIVLTPCSRSRPDSPAASSTARCSASRTGRQNPKFLPTSQVTVIEFGTTGRTNDQGRFRVRLPCRRAPRPGSDPPARQEGLRTSAFRCSSKQRVPATSRRRWSRSHMAARRAPRSSGPTSSSSNSSPAPPTSRPRSPRTRQGGETDLSSYIHELARQYGSAGGGDPG